MNENQLIKTWSDQRSARIRAQLSPMILLAVVLGLTSTGHLTSKSDLTLRIFTISLVATVGVFSVGGMLASVRDGVAVVRTLEEIKSLTPLGKAIRNSSSSLILCGFLLNIFSLFNFVLLSYYLFNR